MEYDAYDVLLKCVLLANINIKQVVGHYKSCNEVMFWFAQMMCYNVYIPLLIRQANDVEENPGPTIFDIIDPTTTVSADSSQGSETIFGVNAGKVMCSNVTSWYYTIKYKILVCGLILL